MNLFPASGSDRPDKSVLGHGQTKAPRSQVFVRWGRPSLYASARDAPRLNIATQS